MYCIAGQDAGLQEGHLRDGGARRVRVPEVAQVQAAQPHRLRLLLRDILREGKNTPEWVYY